jgi:hypothetical protein
MKHPIHRGLQAIRSAGVSPAFMQGVKGRKNAGETPALQLPDPARAMIAR